MQSELRVEVLAPEALGPAEHVAWAAFRSARPELASPYFDLRYTLAAAAETPDTHVAVLHSGGEIAGFLPFQRRGGWIQPIAAPLTDYHGPVCAPDVQPDLPQVVRALGAQAFLFNGLVAPGAAGLLARAPAIADLSRGFEPYVQARRKTHPGFFKTLGKRTRALERKYGEIVFEFGRDAEAMSFILREKRAQYRRSAWPDIFNCGWTERLLRRLLDEPATDFGVRTAVMRVGGYIAAAELCLLGGPVLHLWFPAYAEAFASYSPGMVRTLETLKAAAVSGVQWADFGPGDEAYKTNFTEPRGAVFEGVLAAAPVFGSARPPVPPAHSPDLRARFRRRLYATRGCEPGLKGHVQAITSLAGAASRRLFASLA